MPYRPNSQEIESYRKNGYLVFNRPIFAPDRFAQIKAYCMEKLKQQPGQPPSQLIDCPHWNDPKMFDILFADEMIALVEPLIGPDIGVFASHLLQKPPGTGKRVPWHEDSAYWGQILKPMEVSSITLALEPSVSANGCLRVIPGSHTNGYSDYDQLQRPEEQVFGTEIRKSQMDETKAVDLQLQPNEASIHQARIIHGSNPNTGTSHRAVVTVRYFPTHVKFDKDSHPAFKASNFHIYLARGKDKAGNRYSEPGKTGDVVRGSTA